MSYILYPIKEKGVTIVEIVIVISIIMFFSMIIISDFPKIQKQFALSRATYKLAQDLRRVQNLSLSGIGVKDMNGSQVSVKGYGIYIDTSTSNNKNREYIIYADVANQADINGNQEFNNYDNPPPVFCNSDPTPVTTDCIIEKIIISREHPSLIIRSINSDFGNFYNRTSINFMPPNPNIKINAIDSSPERSEIIIELYNGLSSREILVNKSGLISVK